MFETNKAVETEQSSSPSNYLFDEQYSYKMDNNVTALKNENEILKQKLEMSEKLLYMFIQQKIPVDNNTNLCYTQGSNMQAPESFIND